MRYAMSGRRVTRGVVPFVTVLVMGVLLLYPAPVLAAQFLFQEPCETVHRADLIVLAEKAGEQTLPVPPTDQVANLLGTLHEMMVLRVLKGEPPPGARLAVWTLGAGDGSWTMWAPGLSASIARGQRGVVFLDHVSPGPMTPDVDEELFSLVGGTGYGLWLLDAEGNVLPTSVADQPPDEDSNSSDTPLVLGSPATFTEPGPVQFTVTTFWGGDDETMLVPADVRTVARPQIPGLDQAATLSALEQQITTCQEAPR